jgi:hypothetical protein
VGPSSERSSPREVNDGFRPLTDFASEFHPEPTSRQCVGGPFCGLRHTVFEGEALVVLERGIGPLVEYATLRLRPGQKRTIQPNGGRQIGTYHQRHGRLRWVQHTPKR